MSGRCARDLKKDHRRIEMALKLAHFPVFKDMASFDFEAQRPWLEISIANAENFLLLGPPGVGKTYFRTVT